MKTSVSKILSVLALAATAASVNAAPPTLNSLLEDAQSKIEQSAHQGESKTLEQAKLAVDKALVLEPKNAWAWYFKGYAAYTDFIFASVKNDALAKDAALNEADHALQKSIDLQPSADALALHVSTLAGLIGARGGDAAMQLGPRIGEELSRARQLSPENPRVLMIAGISSLYTPPEWGGDVKEATKLLEHAIAAFATEHPSAPQPTWGLAETHVWLGQAHQKLGDTTIAKAEYEKALAIDPNYAWVKNVILPGLEKPAK